MNREQDRELEAIKATLNDHTEGLDVLFDKFKEAKRIILESRSELGASNRKYQREIDFLRSEARINFEKLENSNKQLDSKLRDIEKGNQLVENSIMRINQMISKYNPEQFEAQIISIKSHYNDDTKNINRRLETLEKNKKYLINMEENLRKEFQKNEIIHEKLKENTEKIRRIEITMPHTIEQSIDMKLREIRNDLESINSGFNKKLAGLERKFDLLSASLNLRFEGLNEGLNKKIDSVNTSLNLRFEGLDEGLNKKIDSVNTSLSTLVVNYGRTTELLNRLVGVADIVN